MRLLPMFLAALALCSVLAVHTSALEVTTAPIRIDVPLPRSPKPGDIGLLQIGVAQTTLPRNSHLELRCMDGELIATIVPFGRPRDTGLTHYTVPVPAPILAKIDPTTLQLPVIVTLKAKPDVSLAGAQVRIGDLHIKLVASNEPHTSGPTGPR